MERQKVLTQRNIECYEWIAKYIQLHQRAPTIREIMRGLELRSPGPVQQQLQRLRDAGKINWIDGKNRTIRLVNRSSLVEPQVDVDTEGLQMKLESAIAATAETKKMAEHWRYQHQIVSDRLEAQTRRVARLERHLEQLQNSRKQKVASAIAAVRAKYAS